MGIYDELAQLDKGHSPLPASPAPKQKQTADQSRKSETSGPSQIYPSQAPVVPLEGAEVLKMDQETTQPQPPASRDSVPPQRHAASEVAVVNLQTNNQTNKLTSKHVYMKTFVAQKPTQVAAFRFPPSLFEKFDEIQYLVKKKHGVKMTRYAIVAAALAFFFWDFEAHGDKSELSQALSEREKK